MHIYTSIKIYKCAVILGNLLQYKTDENNELHEKSHRKYLK